MIGVKQCGYYLALLGILSSTLSVAFSTPSSAVSVYDDWYQVTDTLKLENASDFGGGPCTLDVGSKWLDILQNSKRYPHAYESISSAIHSNGRWGVSLSPVSGGLNTITVFWTQDNSLNLSWEYGSVYAKGNGVTVATLALVDYGGSPTCNSAEIYSYEIGRSAQLISNSSGTTKNYFVFTDHPNYPQGYSGLSIKDSIETITYKYSPEYDYVVNRKNISITYKDAFGGIANDQYKYYSTLFYCTDLNTKVDPCPSDNEVWDSFKDVGDVATIDVDKNGWYILSTIMVKQPTNNPNEDGNVIPKSQMVHMKLVIDGSFYTGSTSDATCNSNEAGGMSNKVCTAEVIQICDLHFPDDIPKYVGCLFNNVFRMLRNVLFQLFIPEPQQFSSLIFQGRSLLSDKLGFLWFPFDFLINLFTTLSHAVDTCTYSPSNIQGSNPNGSFFGSRVNLSVCSAERDLPVIYNFSVFLVRIVTVAILIFALYSRYMQLIEAKGVGRKIPQ